MDLVNVIKLRILRWEAYSVISRWAQNVIKIVFIRERLEVNEE